MVITLPKQQIRIPVEGENPSDTNTSDLAAIAKLPIKTGNLKYVPSNTYALTITKLNMGRRISESSSSYNPNSIKTKGTAAKKENRFHGYACRLSAANGRKDGKSSLTAKQLSAPVK